MRDSTSNHQPHDFLLNRLFKAQIKENIKAQCHWPLWGEFTRDRWIPRTKGRHHYATGCANSICSGWIIHMYQPAFISGRYYKCHSGQQIHNTHILPLKKTLMQTWSHSVEIFKSFDGDLGRTMWCIKTPTGQEWMNGVWRLVAIIGDCIMVA